MLGKKSGQGVSKLTRPKFNEIAKKVPYFLYSFLCLKNFDLARNGARANDTQERRKFVVFVFF